MQTSVIRRPIAAIALAASLLAAFVVLFSPVSASAHDALTSSSPETGATVEVLPSEITLTFSADLITGEGATEVVVTDAAGVSVTDGAAATEGATVTQPLVAEAEAGEYHVVWKVVSSDGHPTSGEYFFTVASGTAPTDEPSPAPTATETMSAPFATAAPSETPTAASDESTASTAWIWILVVVGVVVIAGGIATAIVLSRRARSAPSSAGSDDPAAR